MLCLSDSMIMIVLPTLHPQDLKVLQDLDIHRIITLSAASNPTFDVQHDVLHHRCQVRDSEDQDMRQTIASCLAFIDAAHQQGLRVLIYCDHGM